jgi:hypothetical protein
MLISAANTAHVLFRVQVHYNSAMSSLQCNVYKIPVLLYLTRLGGFSGYNSGMNSQLIAHPNEQSVHRVQEKSVNININ